MKRAFTVLLAALLLCCALAPAAMAAQTPATVSVPVSLTVTGSEPVSGAKAVFYLTPENGGPAPAQATVTLNLKKGENTGAFTLTMDKVGEYLYTLHMGSESTYYKDAYDAGEYVVKVTVSNDVDNNYASLKAAVAIRKLEETDDPDAQKWSAASYSLPLTEVTVNKKWVKNSAKIPESITMRLNRVHTEPNETNDKVSDTYTTKVSDVELTLNGNWTHTWTGLDSRDCTYTVEEIDCPKTFTPSYKQEGNVWNYTNTGFTGDSLIQTGQLNWPIPVLVCFGSLLILAGVWMMRRKEEKDA